MKMKAYLFGIALIAGLNLQAQTSVEELSQIIGQEKVAQLASENPDYMSFLQFRNDRGYYVSNTDGKTFSTELPDALQVLPINDAFPALTEEVIDSGFSMLAYRFEIPSGGIKYYKIGNTGKVLGIYSDAKLQLLKERTE